MAIKRASGGLQAFLLAQPWALVIVSAGIITLIVWAGSSVGWDPWAPVGYGVRHLPLWLLLLLGVPLFASGVVIGIVQQYGSLRRARPPIQR